MALWNEMFNHSIRVLGANHSGMLIENCHNGGPAGNTPHYDDDGELQCPFHTYRSSADIRPQYGSILVNLMSVPPLADKNLSVPGCWAYPDMLEVGVTNMSPLVRDANRPFIVQWGQTPDFVCLEPGAATPGRTRP